MGILIVTAETGPGTLHAAWLSRFYETQLACSADEATDLCRASSPELVLLDLDFPDGNGFAIFQHLAEQNPATQIVVLTAEGTLRQAITAVGLGAADFLVEPVEKERLVASVQRLLSRRTEPDARLRSRLPAAVVQERRQVRLPNAELAVGNHQMTEELPDLAKELPATVTLGLGNKILPLWQIEHLAITHAIEVCDGNIPKAAKLLEISVSTLYRKVRKMEEPG